MESSKFVFALQIISPILIMILKVNNRLQAPNLDLLSPVDIVVSSKTTLQTLRFENIHFSTQKQYQFVVNIILIYLN